MSKDERYLSAAIPEEQKIGKPASRDRYNEQIKAMREEFDALNDALKKRNRDNLDAMYNIDRENLSTDLLSLLNNSAAGVEVLARELDAQVRAFAEFKGNYDSLAEFSAYVSENYASLSMISSVKDSDGNVTAASIVTAVNAAASSVKISSSHVGMSGGQDYSTLAEFATYVDGEYASAGMFSTITDSSGNVTAASIVTAVNGSTSAVMIDADKIQMTGTTTFLTPDDVGDNGSTQIAGNRVSLLMDCTGDDGYTDIQSINELNYLCEYSTAGGTYTRPLGLIWSEVKGNDTDYTSRYALRIGTFTFQRPDGTYVYPALKMYASGRISIQSDYGTYIGTNEHITLDANFVTAIRANKSYSGIGYSVAGYAFCTDGIYYNGTRILST